MVTAYSRDPGFYVTSSQGLPHLADEGNLEHDAAFCHLLSRKSLPSSDLQGSLRRDPEVSTGHRTPTRSTSCLLLPSPHLNPEAHCNPTGQESLTAAVCLSD